GEELGSRVLDRLVSVLVGRVVPSPDRSAVPPAQLRGGVFECIDGRVEVVQQCRDLVGAGSGEGCFRYSSRPFCECCGSFCCVGGLWVHGGSVGALRAGFWWLELQEFPLLLRCGFVSAGWASC